MQQTEQIARSFAAKLLAHIGPEKMAEINRLNATDAYSDGACATHDLCDANVYMASAQAGVLGVTEDYLLAHLNDETLLTQWEDAWQMARDARFWVSQ